MPRSNAESGNIKKFKVTSHTGNSADLTGGIAEFKYYESIVSNTFTATATVVDTGYKGSTRSESPDSGVIDGLPIRGDEECEISVEDANGNTLTWPYGVHVNRVRNSMDMTQKDVFFLDLWSKEAVDNQLTRVMKRYEGKISDHVRDILKNVLKTKMPLDIDETISTSGSANNDFNFLGDDRRPFYTCTWLARKAVPAEAGEPGKAAGFLFWQTEQKYHFKSIDVLFTQEPVKKYIYHDIEEIPEGYDDNIQSFQVVSDVDMDQNMNLGMYHNRSIFFDFARMNYIVVGFNGPAQRPGLELGGIDEKFTGEVISDKVKDTPSRLMHHILDVGAQNDGTGDEQLDNWRADANKPNYDAIERQAKANMRYSELFTIRFNITIPGDFTLHAGDLVYVNYPLLSQDTSNPESGGIYMIANLCHRMTSSDTFTSLTLVRDAFGKKTGMN